MPAVYSLAPGNGVRFVNEEWMYTQWYHDLHIRGAYSRSTLMVDTDAAVTLRPLRSPALQSNASFFVDVTRELTSCRISGAESTADVIRCRVPVRKAPYSATAAAALRATNAMDTCGSGVVVNLFVARNTTSAAAADAVVDWDPAAHHGDVVQVAGFPVTLAVSSLIRLHAVLESAAPAGWAVLRESAAATLSPSSSPSSSSSAAAAGGAWVTLRFSFIFQEVRTGQFWLHCDGSAVDMQVSIRAEANASAAMHVRCLEGGAAASPFRHRVVEEYLSASKHLYINASCTFPAAVLRDPDALKAAFCGVSLEARVVTGALWAWDPLSLPSYAVYELRIPLTAAQATGHPDARAATVAAYAAELTVAQAATAESLSLASLPLPALHTDRDCYQLPWWVVEVGDGSSAASAAAGQRWGGLGYAHQSFVVSATEAGEEVRYCHHFVAFRLPLELSGTPPQPGEVSASPQCPQGLSLTVRSLDATATAAAQAQRVFCGSRSFFMDPITPLQLRVPLIEVPRLVDLDTLIPNTETGYRVYQFCVEVLLDKSRNAPTAAYAQRGPLIYTVLDTMKTPSAFCPWVRTVSPSSTTAVALHDVVYFSGINLRYYDATRTRPLTGPRFAVQLASSQDNMCNGNYLVSPCRGFPELSAELLNDSTLALPITADAPGGVFNMTMTHGELGEVYVDCGLSLHIRSTITSVTASDVLGPAGGTVVRIRGANLPIFSCRHAKLTIGRVPDGVFFSPPNCDVISSTATLIEFATPRLSAMNITQLAIQHEQEAGDTVYWLPLNLATYHQDSRGRWQERETLNSTTVKSGAELLVVPYRVSAMQVTSVHPLTVSCMEEGPTFYVRGHGITSHSVLLCKVSDDTSLTPARTDCVLCLPHAFSAEELVCDALAPLPVGQHRVYVSDIALSGDSGFTVTSACQVETLSPAYVYPYTGGVTLSLVGQWFAPDSASDMQVVAVSGSVTKTYTVAVATLTQTMISCVAPDLSWMEEKGGTVALRVRYKNGTLQCNGQCVVERVQVMAQTQMPRIDSFAPFTGQAPLLITIYGSGFTKLPSSPSVPRSLLLARSGSVDPADADAAAQETYIDVGGGRCLIVDMLNTRILCNLTEPCANLRADTALHLVSVGHGTTKAVSELSRDHFFYCEMQVSAVSHAVGSVAGGQELTITGVGFPPLPSMLEVEVAGAPCCVSAATTSRITCTTVGMPGTAVSLNGPVRVVNVGNGRQSSCCSYTFATHVTPTLTAVSPTTAAAGTRLLLFGTNFPFVASVGDNSTGGSPVYGVSVGVGGSDSSGSGGGRTVLSRHPAMVVMFGARRLVVSDIESTTRASVTVPSDFFGRDYLAVHVAGVGNSPRFTNDLFTVLMTPAVTSPGSGGYRGQVMMRLVGTAVGSNRPAEEVAELLQVYVCGQLCELQDANDLGEIVCRTPSYIDEELVRLHRGSLKFENLREGFTAHLHTGVDFTQTPATSEVVGESWRTSKRHWMDVTALFTGAGSPTYPYTTSIASLAVVLPRVLIVLEAHMHSRLLLYSITLVLSPTKTQVVAMDLSNATCRVRLSTAHAETVELFSTEADPLNASMWRSDDYDSDDDGDDNADAARYTWPPLQMGSNVLHFALFDRLPVAAYVAIACDGLPAAAVVVQEVVVAGYQVGLHASDGRCPVNLRAQQRADQPVMDLCPSRVGASCPSFQYSMALTPIVTHHYPATALASDVDLPITLYGRGFGDDIGAVASVVLDSAACTPVSVMDTQLVCAMQGFVSTWPAWRVQWVNESRRGEAMLLAMQPFYTAVSWSSYLAWMGCGLPKEGNIVVIPAGTTILLDITPPPLSGMLLNGVLVISDDLDVELRLGMLAISNSGALIAGSAAQPHRHRFTISLILNNFDDVESLYDDDITKLRRDRDPSYDRLLNVYGGTLQLHGTPPAVRQARLAETANVGDTSVTLDRWVPWAVGDTVALVTKHDPHPRHTEQRVIARRVANATHTVLYFASEAPLRYRHESRPPSRSDRASNDDDDARTAAAAAAGWGARWDAAYSAATGTDVVYLTRTIVIRGDDMSSISAVGASVWLRNTTTSRLEHVELYSTGKRGTQKGYSVWLNSLHFPIDQVVLRDVVVHDAYYRGVVLQDTRHVVVSELTVVSVDGHGVAATGAAHDRLTVANSLLVGSYADGGGLDIVPAGLYSTAADVALLNTEVCASGGHGVWYALRLVFVALRARTCPGQRSLATLRGNRVHHVHGHGLVVVPLHVNMGGRCHLSANVASANDPVRAAAAAMAATMEGDVQMGLAGAVHEHLIFSCGLYGVYLPPSSGYVVLGSAIADCGAASLFLDYTTNTTVVSHTYVAGVLPDGSCTTFTRAEVLSFSTSSSSDNSSSTSEAAGCRSTLRVAVEAHHGGHLVLDAVTVANFATSTALRLAALTSPSSQATSYPAGSYAALRSKHHTVRSSSIRFVGEVGQRLLVAGQVALEDLDGRMTQTHQTTTLIYGGAVGNVTAAPPYCTAVRHVRQHEARGSASSTGVTVWSVGKERVIVGVGGVALTELVDLAAVDDDDEGSGGSGGGARAVRLQDAWVCTAPSEVLSLLYLEVAPAPVGSGARPVPCHTAAVEVQYGDGSRVALRLGLTERAQSPAAASAASLYLFSNDDDPANAWPGDGMGIGAGPTWNPPRPATADSRGGAGFYKLQSETNMSITFFAANGGVCYPIEFTLKADTALARPTLGLLVQLRVEQNTLYFHPSSEAQTSCAHPPLMGDVTWRWNTDTGNATSEPNVTPPLTSSNDVDPHEELLTRPHTVSRAIAVTTLGARLTSTWLSLALNPLCLRSPAVAGDRSPWNSSPSLWAGVQVRVCERLERKRDSCVGPRFPYLSAFVPSLAMQMNAPYTSWYSATAWEDGNAPWAEDVIESVPRAAHVAFVIPYGTRVHLHMDATVVVPGVLLVVGELLITTAAPTPAATCATTPSNTGAGKYPTEANDAGAGGYPTEPADSPPECTVASVVTLRMQSLVVLGKLNISATDPTAPVIRLVLNAGDASATPYELDMETTVYPGTFYAAGEVELTGDTTAPTVWRATSAVRANSSVLPSLVNAASDGHLQAYCTRLAELEAGTTASTTTTPTALQAAVETCVAAVRRQLPQWMQENSDKAGTLLVWRNQTRIGITSGSSALDEAELNTVASDVMADSWAGPDERTRGCGGCRVSIAASGPPRAAAEVATRWKYAHGGAYTHDATPRRAGSSVYGEVVGLSKTIELECAAPVTSTEDGCMLLITRQRHPVGLFRAPRFRASGVALRSFGKRGQQEASVMPAAAPLSFLPAVYVNVSAGAGDVAVDDDGTERLYRITEHAWGAGGFAVFVGCVVEQSYGTAVYTDRRNTHLFMVDSAVWDSRGGGVRLDGGGIGVFMTGVVVAGTRYARSGCCTDLEDAPELSVSEATGWQNTAPLALSDFRVTSMCSVLLNNSHALRPAKSAALPDWESLHPTLVTTVPFLMDVVAAGSESEGFCVPWAGSGGPDFMAYNTVHSSFIGLFLFREARQLDVATLFTRATAELHGICHGSRAAVGRRNGKTYVLPSYTTGVNDYIALGEQDAAVAAATRFAWWTIYGNRFLGVFSSGHQNVTVADSDIFANPIGVALAVDPAAPSGASRVVSSYIATFPGCSDTVDTANATAAAAAAAAAATVWSVCQHSALAEVPWNARGCGPLTFVDASYHYAAVLAMPSHEYIPLSYNRSIPVTSPSRSMPEAATRGQLLLDDVLFGAVGELTACTGAESGRAVNPTGGARRSAAVMGTNGAAVLSSASLWSIVLSHVRYAPSSAPALTSAAGSPTTPHASPSLLQHAQSVASVLRLRPDAPRAPLWQLSPPDTEEVDPGGAYPTEEPRRPSAAQGDAAAAAAAAAARVLEDAGRNPYRMTAVNDLDGSAYNHRNGPQIYTARDRPANDSAMGDSAAALQAAVCDVELPQQQQLDGLAACSPTTLLQQVRLQSLDTRSSLSAIAGRVSFRVEWVASSLTSSLQSVVAAERRHGSTSATAVLQVDGRLPQHNNATVLTALSGASPAQFAFLVPQGTVTLEAEPDVFPEMLQVSLAGCDPSSLGFGATTLLRVPLMDEDATVNVWATATSAQLEPASCLRNVSAAREDVSFWDVTAAVSSPATQLSALDKTLRWLRYTTQSNVTGATSSTLLLEMSCGASAQIHQLVYGMAVLFASEDLDVVAQRLLRSGTEVPVTDLVPLEKHTMRELASYAASLRVSVLTIYPDAIMGEGTWLILKVEAVDQFRYDTRAAVATIASFLKLLNKDASYYSTHMLSSSPAPSAALQQTLQTALYGSRLHRRRLPPEATAAAAELNRSWMMMGDLRSSKDSDDDNNNNNKRASLTVGGLKFLVVLTMPAVLPSERALLRSLLKGDAVLPSRGDVSRTSIIACALVLGVAVLMLGACAVVRVALPSLRHRKDAPASSAALPAPSGAAAGPGWDTAATGTPTATVWVAGLLRSTLVATLDKSGVTRSGEEAAAVVGQRIDVAQVAASMLSFGLFAPAQERSVVGGAKTVTRRMFLLPSYDVMGTPTLAGDCSGAPAASAARHTAPQNSREVEEQRYVAEWRIASSTAAALMQRSGTTRALAAMSLSRDATTAGAGPALAAPPAPTTAVTEPPFAPATAPPAPSIAVPRRVGSAFSYLSASTSSALGRLFDGDAAQHRRTPGSSSSSGPTRPGSVENRDGSPDAKQQTSATEHVIPVRFPPPPPPPPPPLSPTEPHERLAAANAANAAAAPPTLQAEPPLPCGGDAAEQSGPHDGPPAETAADDHTVPQTTESSPPRPPIAQPVALQSILTTSLLAGTAMLAYPSPPPLIGATAAATAAATGGYVGRSRAGPGGNGALTSPSTANPGALPPGGHASDGPLEDATLVLRGRGQILFTTPSADPAAAGTPRRALRVAMSAGLTPRDPLDYREENS
ncbi:IPT/TIG domain/G8 domain containing protein [Novymonas esmeraldas]|uniref:IPT/TIG domain/G8 domain containing protein n=1 Tax=Novymonas esmeraldas TaxID=1808958 RepID=A0AAW0ESN1_9TRYP